MLALFLSKVAAKLVPLVLYLFASYVYFGMEALTVFLYPLIDDIIDIFWDGSINVILNLANLCKCCNI